ncbi:MAG: hypothetical protein WBQ16_02220 [Nitrososphaeraceae archaeon]
MSNKTTMELEKSTLQNVKSAGRKSQTYDALLNQRITCNAAGCQKIGSIEIHVKAGKFGTVTLFVCANCVGKFTD